MAVANTALTVENEAIDFTNALPKEADFEALCTGCYLYATQNCHIAFDRAANSRDFYIAASTFYHMEKVNFTRISAIGDSTTGILYICATRVSN